MKIKGLIFAGLAILAGMTVSAVAGPSQPSHAATGSSLLKKATRVLALADYGQGQVDHPWLSDHELLHLTSHGQLSRYDLNTKTDTPLVPLTHQLKTSRASSFFLDTSPDGHSVIWGKVSNTPYFVASVDGSRRVQWPGNRGLSESYWCADSHHWIEFQIAGMPGNLRFTHVFIHNIDTPDHSEPISTIPAGLQGLEILDARSANWVIARKPDGVRTTPAPPGPTSPDGETGMSFIIEIHDRKTQEISVWSLHPAQALHQGTINFPGLVSEASVSPQSDRIAWLVTTVHAAPAAASGSLWISHLDGSQMHQIGSFDLPISLVNVHQHYDLTSLPSQIRWLPSGQKISFLYHDALWTVPAK